MKTLIVYNDIESALQFLIVEGDYSRFNGVAVNSTIGNGYEEEFCKWMFEEDTGERNHLGEWSEDVSLIESKEWDKVAICMFIP